MAVSLVMIARDNRDTIRAALEDARRAGCSELVVVDTGSKDDTPQICAELGATVHHRPWVDDFAHSRNEALDLASNDWCLILDSDDRIDRAGELHAFIRDDIPRIPDTCHCIVMSVLVGIGPQAITVSQIRMVRRSSGLRYRFPLHERIDPPDGVDVYYLREVSIVHRRPMDPTHTERNLRILEKARSVDGGFAHRDHGEQQHIRLNLGREYLGLRRLADARRAFDEYFAAGTAKERTDYWANHYRTISCESDEEREQWVTRTIEVNPWRAEAYCERAALYCRQARFHEAKRDIAQALGCRQPTDGVVNLPDYTWRPLLLLALIHHELGAYALAMQAAKASQRAGCPPELLRDASIR